MDYRNAWQKGMRPWKSDWGHPLRSEGAHRWRAELVLPSGWMKSFPRLGMRPIARVVRHWRRRHAAGAPLTLLMTYPYYLALRDLLRPEQSVYYNLDDYTLYWPARTEEVRTVEARAVRESDLTICVSRLRHRGTPRPCSRGVLKNSSRAARHARRVLERDALASAGGSAR